ncbi:MAG: hypothetical protein JWM80_2147 [Cyanobacteria bacterium RYN_339]|nr:hypothetical protein [Cyanobacteria bacterium RYN_339]
MNVTSVRNVTPRPAPGGVAPVVDQLLDYRPFQPRHYADAVATALAGAPARLPGGLTLRVSGDQVEVGPDHFRLEVAPGVDRQAVLAGVLEYFLQTPAPVRGLLRQVKVEAGSWWTALFKSIYATGGNGTLTFFDGTAHLDAATFHHEMGHLVGQGLPGHEAAHPAGWPEANAADGRSVSAYARTNWEENFAEFWRRYVQDRAGIRKTYPAQSALLERTLAELPG